MFRKILSEISNSVFEQKDWKMWWETSSLLIKWFNERFLLNREYFVYDSLYCSRGLCRLDSNRDLDCLRVVHGNSTHWMVTYLQCRVEVHNTCYIHDQFDNDNEGWTCGEFQSANKTSLTLLINADYLYEDTLYLT